MPSQHESWAGNLVAWATTTGFWGTLGATWPTILVTVLTAWWTVEKARTERAKRRYYEENSVSLNKGTLRKMLARFSPSEPIPLDDPLDDQQDHHKGK